MMSERKVDHLLNDELFSASDLSLKPKELRSSNKASSSTGKSVLSGKKTSGVSALPSESSSGSKVSPLAENEIKSLKKEIVSSGKETVSSAKNASADPLSVGARLKKVRETKGLSLDIVHEGTKIPMDALRAIEEGYSVRILSPFYYKGFLKIYGDFLGVNVADARDEDSRSKASSDAKNDEGNFFFRDLFARSFNVTKLQQGLSFLFVLFFFFLLFKGIVFIFHRPRSTPSVEQYSKRNSPSSSTARQETPPLPRPRVVVPSPVPVVPPVQDAAVISEPSVAPVTSVEVRPVPTPVAPLSPPAPAPGVVKNVTLVVRARTDSWLRVAVDGEVVFQATLGTGSVKTWLADEKIEISGRNLEQLEMELNGKMIGALGRRQRGAKSILITENGLTVLQ